MRSELTYLISPNEALRLLVETIVSETASNLLLPCIWTAHYGRRSDMTRDDAFSLAKVMFLMSRLDRPEVAGVIRDAGGGDMVLSELFFDKYWAIEQLMDDSEVQGSITDYSNNELFPEMLGSVNERILRYIDAVRNAPKPWELKESEGSRKAEKEKITKEIFYVISSLYDLSPDVDPDTREYLLSKLLWRGKYPETAELTPNDDTQLVKLLFLVELADMSDIRDIIADAVGGPMQITEAFFDKHWMIERFAKDHDVQAAILEYREHSRFSELRSSVNETIADHIDGVIAKGLMPRLY